MRYSIAEQIPICPCCFRGLSYDAKSCPYCGFDYGAYYNTIYDFHMGAYLSFSWIDPKKESNISINKNESFIIEIKHGNRSQSLTLSYPNYYGMVEVPAEKHYDISIKTIYKNKIRYQSHTTIEKDNYIRHLAIGLKTDSAEVVKSLFRSETVHALSIIQPGSSKEKQKQQDEPFDPQKVFEVEMDVAAHWNDNNDLVVELNTNLPDKTILNIFVSCGNNYDPEDETAYEEETEVVVSKGKAISDGFSHKNEMINGGYDLCIVTQRPQNQDDSVIKVIGKKGEYLSGKYVREDSYDHNKSVDLYYTLVIKEDKIILEPSDDYKYTFFLDS